MEILLSIADIVVLILVVISVARAVWTGQTPSPGAKLLSACIVLALLVFAMVSLSAASGLAQGPSTLGQGILLVFLVGIAIVAGVSWKKEPAR